MFIFSHPTSSSSCAEILAVLFFRTMKYKVDDPRDLSSDRFIMSKVSQASRKVEPVLKNCVVNTFFFQNLLTWKTSKSKSVVKMQLSKIFNIF